MNLNVELLQFYRCRSLSELLERTGYVFETIGFAHLVLKWSPSAGASSKMCENSSVIWNNFDNTLGDKAIELTRLITESVRVGLDHKRRDTHERQTWRLSQDRPYRVSADAPKRYYLTEYQRALISDFGEPDWIDFFALSLCKERERMLVLEAKTQDAVSEQRATDARNILSVFECAYLCLHRPTDVHLPIDQSEVSHAPLSRREVQCLHWLAAGKTFSEAAMILDISERTMRFHVGNAKRRLGVSSTMQAVVSAAMMYGFDPRDTRRSLYLASRHPSRLTEQQAS